MKGSTFQPTKWGFGSPTFIHCGKLLHVTGFTIDVMLASFHKCSIFLSLVYQLREGGWAGFSEGNQRWATAAATFSTLIVKEPTNVAQHVGGTMCILGGKTPYSFL